MYLSPSRYNDIFPGDGCPERFREARCGIPVFLSVLLHLLVIFCFFYWLPGGKGCLMPGDRIVEINLVSLAGSSYGPAGPVIIKNVQGRTSVPRMLKSSAPVKHAAPVVAVPPKIERPKEISEKPEEKPVIIKEEIETPVKSNELLPGHSSEVIGDENTAPLKNVSYSSAESNPEMTSESTGSYADEPASIDGTGNSGPGPTSSDPGEIPSGQGYVDENFYYVKDLITRNIVYPAVARRMKWQGTVEVSFVVLENGSVEDIRIVASSGYSVLDKNIVSVIKSVQPFPGPPTAAEFTMPIRYILKN